MLFATVKLFLFMFAQICLVFWKILLLIGSRLWLNEGKPQRGLATDRRLSDRPFNRPTNGIRPKITKASDRNLYCNWPIRSLASVTNFNDAIGFIRKFGPMTHFLFTYFFGTCRRSAP